MKLESTLRKEGIEVLKPFDTLTVNIIAKRISDKLCRAFPEHGFLECDLFSQFSRLNMYSAKMPDSLTGAKYFYKNHSIYFNADFSLEHCISFATHECLHYLQEQLDSRGNLIRLGLYDLNSDCGIAINEAAVQLMTVEACHESVSSAKYYGLDLKTASPTYYPLECVLVKQIAYFTGTYPLYHSTLYGDDIFKNTFIALSDSQTYEYVEKNLDHMLWLESELERAITALQVKDNTINRNKRINQNIDTIKKQISDLFLATQDKIFSHCFSNEFSRIKNLEDVKEFQKRLYNFKDLIGTNSSYEFYNEFYRRSMEKLEEKKTYIEEHGQFDMEKELTKDITVISNAKGAFTLWRRIVARLSFSKSREELL